VRRPRESALSKETWLQEGSELERSLLKSNSIAKRPGIPSYPNPPELNPISEVEAS